QNGVANERQALRLFPDVYGVCVMLPADHLEPVRVRVFSDPPGRLDVGRYPSGVDATASALGAAFAAAGFGADARPEIMRWKRRKLLLKLDNALEPFVGTLSAWPGPGQFRARLMAEGTAVLAAAGIDVVSEQEAAAGHSVVPELRAVGGFERRGGSTTQSLQ